MMLLGAVALPPPPPDVGDSCAPGNIVVYKVRIVVLRVEADGAKDETLDIPAVPAGEFWLLVVLDRLVGTSTEGSGPALAIPTQKVQRANLVVDIFIFPTRIRF